MNISKQELFVSFKKNIAVHQELVNKLLIVNQSKLVSGSFRHDISIIEDHLNVLNKIHPNDLEKIQVASELLFLSKDFSKIYFKQPVNKRKQWCAEIGKNYEDHVLLIKELYSYNSYGSVTEHKKILSFSKKVSNLLLNDEYNLKFTKSTDCFTLETMTDSFLDKIFLKNNDEAQMAFFYKKNKYSFFFIQDLCDEYGDLSKISEQITVKLISSTDNLSKTNIMVSKPFIKNGVYLNNVPTQILLNEDLCLLLPFVKNLPIQIQNHIILS